MPSNFSAYLDLVRFLAAMVVFLGHASGIPWTAQVFSGNWVRMAIPAS
jgi:hypothetical protein